MLLSEMAQSFKVHLKRCQASNLKPLTKRQFKDLYHCNVSQDKMIVVANQLNDNCGIGFDQILYWYMNNKGVE